MSIEATTRAGEAHGSAKSYNVGFLFCLVLTLIPFALVMHPVLPRATTLLLAVVLGVVQVIVQLVYFLHMSRSSEGGWNLISFVFTLVILFIIVALSVWIIWSMHYNMMIN
ncbi:Cytochrome O ubiquinol oxidase subunit IV [Paraburkholderia hospita]|uniref:Cytochrome bo(3) ubiquinol oxidase subunit 4 n=1 Tax=Paraburkholderia hospita TaxID=169430 RepID=A0ABN0F6B1_9BURK|nr:cytochrome o ubiquinol oxidase subunit IV [Paraburkholderia hospita]EIM94058.1 Cytochrome O ubiquinol oxidase subunit IV [Paraburkholderia hospita]OUL77889.1 cytochrome o ubiquinol oxidase subunit IV [Paraburkholderia hospita]